MHPEIEKFWTSNSEHYIETDVFLPGALPYYLFWFLMKDGRQIRCVGQSDPYDRNSEAYHNLKEDPPCTKYYYNNKLYSEEQMLRIIRLKAFL